jgi:hypothetical protein
MVRRKYDDAPSWRFTGFYGALKVADMHHSWSGLRTLATIEHPAWLCMGDFNDTLYTLEQFSRAARLEWPKVWS